MSSRKKLRDWNVDTKIKIASLWIIYMFVFIYTDYYKMFIPGVVDDMMSGILEGIPLSPLLLFVFSAITIFPAFMIFLSLLLPAKLNRWLNAIIGLIYMIISVNSLIGHVWAFWIFYCIILTLVTVIIVIYSWKWPLEKSNQPDNCA